jgi:hypothetical protein
MDHFNVRVDPAVTTREYFPNGKRVRWARSSRARPPIAEAVCVQVYPSKLPVSKW